jgi:16S rRNA (cytosine1402-N4)-methyltransferase
MVNDGFYHAPVLLEETLELLVTGSGIYIDGTLGGGGHSEAILKRLHEKKFDAESLLIGLDRDSDAIAFATQRLGGYKNFVARQSVFSEMTVVLNAISGDGKKVRGVLLDLGISSHHIDAPERGFSFQKDAPLDMRMDKHGSLTAKDIINTYSEKDLADVLWKYGDERKSRLVAKRIAEARAEKPIETTLELAAIIRRCFPFREQQSALARVFQAVRIEVNDELGELERTLTAAHDLLEDGGRLLVMSYHSLEDRMVKTFFREKSTDDWGPKGIVLKEPLWRATMTLLTKKPIEPSGTEVERNSRARSAKLRAAGKVVRSEN